MHTIEKQYRQSVADVDTEKWPAYVVFNNDSVMVVERGIPFEINLTQKQVKAHGVVDTNKWLCYDAVTADLDTKSSEILRLFLNV